MPAANGAWRDTRRCGGRRRTSRGKVDARHRKSVERGFDQRLLIDAVEVADAGEVVLLGVDQCLAERHGADALAELAGEQGIELGAVGEEVGVGVLISGAGDQCRLLLGHCLGPVERARQPRYAVGVEEVVPGMTSGADDHRVLEDLRVRLEVGRRDAGLVVGGERVVGTEVAREEDEIVVRWSSDGGEIRRGPRAVTTRGAHCRRRRRHALVRDQGVGSPGRFRDLRRSRSAPSRPRW